MDVSDDRLQSALTRLERLLDLGESVRGSDVTVPMPRLIPLAMAANGAVEMLAELGVCPADRLAEFRTRLERLGVERSTGQTARSARGGGTFSSGPSAPSKTSQGAGGPVSVSDWQRQQLDQVRERLQPPVDESPTVVPLSLVLGRSDTVVVVLLAADVYTNGILWSVSTHGRGAHPPFFPTRAALAQRMGLPPATAPDLSITFDDGRRSVAVDRFEATGVADLPPDQPTLVVGHGNGNNDLLRRDLWLTPQPTPTVTIDSLGPSNTSSQAGTWSTSLAWCRPQPCGHNRGACTCTTRNGSLLVTSTRSEVRCPNSGLDFIRHVIGLAVGIPGSLA